MFVTRAVERFCVRASIILYSKLAGVLSLSSFQPIQAELVDDQQVEAGIVAQPPWQRLVRQRGGQVLDQGAAGRVADTQSLSTGSPANALDDPAFAHAALTDKDQVVLAADEVARGQFLDLRALDRGGVELPVEALQGVRIAEAGVADALGDAAFAALVGLFAEEQSRELQVRQAVVLGAAQGGVELLGTQRHVQRGAVGQQTLTQVRCRRLVPGRVRRAERLAR